MCRLAELRRDRLWVRRTTRDVRRRLLQFAALRDETVAAARASSTDGESDSEGDPAAKFAMVMVRRMLRGGPGEHFETCTSTLKLAHTRLILTADSSSSVVLLQVQEYSMLEEEDPELHESQQLPPWDPAELEQQVSVDSSEGEEAEGPVDGDEVGAGAV